MSNDPIVLVGGGLASGTAATELRSGGYDGPLVLIAGEPHLPYERPPLSKSYLQGKDPAEKTFVHDQQWYDDHGVEVRTGTRVTAIDPDRRRLQVGDQELAWSGLLLATGAEPRHLDLADRSGAPVTYLRTLEDSTALREQLREGRRIGIIGGGWIGLEVAAAARDAGAEVVVLETLAQPLLRVLGEEVAGIFADLHRKHGVDLRTNVRIDSITSHDDGVRIKVAENGSSTPVTVDHLIVGIGAVPSTELAEGAGLSVDNGIRTDAHLQTSAPGVYAAGDVANVDHPVLGHPVRVEHWDAAIQHGKVAAANLAGDSKQADALPYFFTDQYDLGMEYVGSPGPAGFDDVRIEGDVDALNFKVWWLREGRTVAGMHVNDWDAIDEVRTRVAEGSVQQT